MRYQIRHADVEYGAYKILNDINFEIHDKETVSYTHLTLPTKA